MKFSDSKTLWWATNEGIGEKDRNLLPDTQCCQGSFFTFFSYSKSKPHKWYQCQSCREQRKQVGCKKNMQESQGQNEIEELVNQWRRWTKDSEREGMKSDRGRKSGSARIVNSLQKTGYFKGLNSPEGGCEWQQYNNCLYISPLSLPLSPSFT